MIKKIPYGEKGTYDKVLVEVVYKINEIIDYLSKAEEGHEKEKKNRNCRGGD